MYQFKPNPKATKKRVRKGRGNASGFGGECGRGHKGQRSRSGFKSRPGFEGGQTPLYRRLPKLRGLGNNPRSITEILNVSDLEQFFNDGDTVSVETLTEKGLISNKYQIKILGNGEITKKLTVIADKFSKTAIEKITSASGSYEIAS